MVLLALAGIVAQANGIYRNGTGAQSMSMGGADVAWGRDPLSAMTSNPAGLASATDPLVSLGAVAGSADGTFTRAGSGGDLDSRVLAAPELAFALPVSNGHTVLGFSASADSGLSADWNFTDPPGGLASATSYGLQRHRARITVLRTAVGAGFRITPRLSLGANLGLLYNENRLQSPYTFQSQPALRGAKTLLDLRTDGFGWNVQLGALYQMRTNLQLGVSYRSGADVHSTGTATGDAGVQLGVPSLPFRYDAQVNTAFPHQVAAGVSWRPMDRLRLAGQVEWIGWSSAFDELPVQLSNGSSAAINGVVGGSSLLDVVPLNWKDRWVFRAGAEYRISTSWVLRAGYAFGESPVPSSTLTPMNAALMEHTATAGAGYEHGRWSVDLAYQYDLPSRRGVGTSGLLSGEYSNSSTEVSVQTVALTARYRF